jgi:allantoicase
MENRFNTDLIDLASEAYGGRTLLASDDFFAPKENLLKPGRGVFIEDKYTDHGKWMDGWESRRKRTEGHDWCILRLGRPGIFIEVDIDTHHFIGNFPSHASVHACSMPEFSGLDEIIENGEWKEILPKVKLNGDSQNIFQIISDQSFTHVRLHIYPDGGVARFRVYGKPEIPDASDNELKDFALCDNGGKMISCSDMHFSHMENLIKPTTGIDMSDGWETKRRRGPGYDWSILKLGSPCTIERIIVDTLHFKGNFPDTCSIEGCYEPDKAQDWFLNDNIEWTELLPNSKLAANQETIFILSKNSPITHIRFNIIPDGGVSRLRILGREAS